MDKELDQVRTNLSAHGLALEEIKMGLTTLLDKAVDSEATDTEQPVNKKARRASPGA